MKHHVSPSFANTYNPAPKKVGRESNEITDEPESPHVDDEKRLPNRYILDNFLYYARAVDLTI